MLRQRKTMTTLSAILALLAFGASVLAARSPAQAGRQLATTTPTAVIGETLHAISTENFGPPPAECPRGPEPMKFSDDWGSGVGGYPVWVLGMGGPYATLYFFNGSNNTRTSHGWADKKLWVVKRTYHGAVRLHGGSLRDSTPLWFQIGGNPPTTEPVLDLSGPETRGDKTGWADFPSYLFIPSAGCYFLEAEWEGGRWRLDFAAGSVDEPRWKQTQTAWAPQ
jgi:hypothetical protein